MGLSEWIHGDDVVLDQAAFDKAIADFAALSEQLVALRIQIEEMLAILEKGFATPAGAKFMQSCERGVFGPIEDQRQALLYISENLRRAKQAYEQVFSEYESLQSTIRSLNNQTY